jgi:hypothetical protein
MGKITTITTEWGTAYTEETIEREVDGVGITIDDFVAYLKMHNYIYMPSGDFWPAASVNAVLPRMPVLDAQGRPERKNGKPVTMSATTWLDQNRRAAHGTWCPGQPQLIADRMVIDGGWVEREDVMTFNFYRRPRIKPIDGHKAGRWVAHVGRVFDAPGDAEHIIRWLAHHVQRPEVKVNHALVLGGLQGIGKDTILEPVKHAVGPWNFHEVQPTQLLGKFNDFLKSVILRVNEARDHGDSEHRANRFDFYEHTKTYTTAPPDVLRINEKNEKAYYAFNTMGFLITTNHKTDGIYLPADDRRHYVAWSDRRKEDFPTEYWDDLWGWYERGGGFENVAAYLDELDISEFNPKAPPKKTAAFWEIVDIGQAPEDGELADVIDALKNPDALTIADLVSEAKGDTLGWLMERKKGRAIQHRLERCGYVSARNPASLQGLWIIKGVRQQIYVKASLLPTERQKAAIELFEERNK